MNSLWLANTYPFAAFGQRTSVHGSCDISRPDSRCIYFGDEVFLAQFGEIGAGLQLAPNASHALARLGVLDAIARYAVYPKRLLWREARTGARITALDLGEPFLAHYGHRYVVMHRGDLLDVLLEGCNADQRIVLEPSRDVVGVEQHDDGVRVRCADGAAYAGCAAVAPRLAPSDAAGCRRR